MEQAGGIIHKAEKAGRGTLSEYEGKQILAAYGIPVVGERLASGWEQVAAAAGELGYPVVLKACDPALSHKSEAGLVHLNLGSEAELRTAHQALNQAGQGASCLVQKMVKGPRELVMGMIRDPAFGPCVMFGLGGIFTEALGQVCFCPAPLSQEDAARMLEETEAGKLLGALRGLPAVDREALITSLVNLGQLALDHPQVREIDINPLVVQGSAPLAVDCLMVLGPPEPQPVPARPRGGLEAFFAPRSVVVVGASPTPGKAGNDVVRNILDNGFAGDLYLVNPKGGQILGLPVLTSLEQVPQGVDQAIIILPAGLNPQAIRQCGARGIKAVVLAAGGFAEVDDSGQQLQEELIQAIEESGARVLGPNTSGHTSTPGRFTSSFFPLGPIPRGHISFLAQTGNFATHTMRYISTAEHFGVARVIGMGNKVDLEEAEALEYLAQDPETEAIFMYLESIKYPRRFLAAARQASSRKPVVLLKGGRTATGARAAVAHTAAMASDQRIIAGALKQAGVVQVTEYSHLFLAAKALAGMPLPAGNRVSIMGPSGAMLVVLSDLCRTKGLAVPDLEESTRQRLQEISPPFIRMRNPVDIWGAASMRGMEYAYYNGMDAVLGDPNLDAVVAILMLTDRTGVPPLDFVVDLARRHPAKPIYITFSGEKKHMEAAKAFLEPQGVPTFPLIEEPLEVLGILAQCRRALGRNSSQTD